MSRSKSTPDEKVDRSELDEQELERLYNAIWICKIGNFNVAESMAFVNSGEIGYKKQSKKDIEEKRLVPITISQATFYRHKKILESPEFQTKQVFKIFREEYLAEIVSRFKLFKSLEAKSLRALESEDDPHKQQLIINGIFRNSPYTTSLMDIIKQIVERNKMPFPKNAEVEKILKQEGVTK